MKRLFSAVLLVLHACAGHAPPSETPASAPAAAAEKPDQIRIEAPAVHAVIASPLRLAGSARGPWFFEATFPVKLLDAQGNQVAQGFVQANGEWMTTEFVPFEGELTFTVPTSTTGTLVFEKANASGLPEHADELRVPVRFSARD